MTAQFVGAAVVGCCIEGEADYQPGLRVASSFSMPSLFNMDALSSSTKAVKQV